MTLTKKLEALSQRIAGICHISGTLGASQVALYGGGIYLPTIRLRDVQAKLTPTSEMNYCIAPMGEAITSAAFGILMGEGKIRWNGLIRGLCTTYQSEDRSYHDLVTVTDLLSH